MEIEIASAADATNLKLSVWVRVFMVVVLLVLLGGMLLLVAPQLIVDRWP